MRPGPPCDVEVESSSESSPDLLNDHAAGATARTPSGEGSGTECDSVLGDGVGGYRRRRRWTRRPSPADALPASSPSSASSPPALLAMRYRPTSPQLRNFHRHRIPFYVADMTWDTSAFQAFRSYQTHVRVQILFYHPSLLENFEILSSLEG